MRIPTINFRTQTFELADQSASELLTSINDYFIKAPTFSSPGNKEFASGEVNFDERKFKVNPIITDWNNRAIRLFAYGTISDNSITVRFGTPLTFFIIPLIFYGILIRIFISANWISVSHITLPTLTLVLLLNFLLTRRFYKKDLRNHLEFLNKLNVR